MKPDGPHVMHARVIALALRASEEARDWLVDASGRLALAVEAVERTDAWSEYIAARRDAIGAHDAVHRMCSLVETHAEWYIDDRIRARLGTCTAEEIAWVLDVQAAARVRGRVHRWRHA